MKKENQRVTISKRMLKEGVLRLLENKHIAAISVSELCEESSINRTTFYRHYQTTSDVLMELEEDFMNELQESPKPLTGTQDIRTNAFRICHFLYDHKDTAKIFISNDTDSHFRMLFQNFADEYIKSKMVSYKGKSVNANTLHLLTTYCAHGVYSMVHKWLIEEIPMTPDEVADLIVGSFNRDFCIA